MAVGQCHWLVLIVPDPLAVSFTSAEATVGDKTSAVTSRTKVVAALADDRQQVAAGAAVFDGGIGALNARSKHEVAGLARGQAAAVVAASIPGSIALEADPVVRLDHDDVLTGRTAEICEVVREIEAASVDGIGPAVAPNCEHC